MSRPRHHGVFLVVAVILISLCLQKFARANLVCLAPLVKALAADLLRVTDHAATAAYTKVPYFARMHLSDFTFKYPIERLVGGTQKPVLKLCTVMEYKLGIGNFNHHGRPRTCFPSTYVLDALSTILRSQVYVCASARPMLPHFLVSIIMEYQYSCAIFERLLDLFRWLQIGNYLIFRPSHELKGCSTTSIFGTLYH